jgi:hypothetical protein
VKRPAKRKAFPGRAAATVVSTGREGASGCAGEGEGSGEEDTDDGSPRSLAMSAYLARRHSGGAVAVPRPLRAPVPRRVHYEVAPTESAAHGTVAKVGNADAALYSPSKVSLFAYLLPYLLYA